MARKLIYRITDPGYTIYHRAALGGLAATVRAWRDSPPDGIVAHVERDHVKLEWDDSVTDKAALRSILDASFRLTEDKLIDLPGQAIPAGSIDLRLAIHNGLCITFLQHNKMRPSEKEPRNVVIRDADDDAGEIFTYKAINSYAHQKAQGTGLLDAEEKNAAKIEKLPNVATISQSSVPGAMSGAKPLDATPDEAILLLFLMVGCSIFLLRPRTFKEKAQACVVIPDVNDLVAFSRAIHQVAMAGHGIKRFSNTYLGRVVGGAEEAALRFLLDLWAEDIGEQPGIIGCQAVAMGKVAWDKNQMNRSVSIKLGMVYPELDVFRQATTYLGQSKIIKSAKGEGFAIPCSPVPELLAANLAAGRHWAAHFRELVKEKKDFERMSWAKRGLIHMKDAITDQNDQSIIRAFHEAWNRKMGELGERARRDGLDFGRLVEVERERIRNAILRTKTADALAGWFLRFCADATKGASLGAIRDDAARLRTFIFNPRNTDRFQNLLLFALVSYSGDDSKQSSEGGV
jgi:CRISPR-associated protein Cas8a1/Csx13